MVSKISISVLLIFGMLFSGCSKINTKERVVITVIDKSAPKIKILKKATTITEGDEFNIDKCFQVEDNVTKEPDIQIENGGFDSNKPGSYKITVTATDEAGNVTSATFKVTVDKKPEPEPEPEPEPVTPPSNNNSWNENSDNGNNNSSSGSNNSNSGSQGTETPVTPPPVVVEPPASKQDFFPFLEGEHDGGVAAGGRCISAGWLYCEPWDIDGDGVYDGMKGS